MSTKTEAKERIESASRGCDKALSYWKGAAAALNSDVGVNGYGIIHDRYAFRQKLYEAQARIEASLAALDAVQDWPLSVDYNQV